jgi:hypothetical protein
MSLALYERVAIEGMMPERALLRLKRAGIAVYKLQKPQKNRVEFCVNRKDIQKVFAIYPKICYNKSVQSAFFAESLGAVGLLRAVRRISSRIGVLLGVLVFLATSVYLDGFVFGVDVAGTDAYEREVKQTLASYGIKPFCRYQSGNEDIVCAKLLALKNVEFCSVQKDGLRVRVEMRLSPFEKPTFQNGDMQSTVAGTLLSLTVLKGTAQKHAGDKIAVGDTLVSGYLQTETGEKQTVYAVAIARVACEYSQTLQTQTAEEAFATAYLQLGLYENAQITATKTEQTDAGFCVQIRYQKTLAYNY